MRTLREINRGRPRDARAKHRAYGEGSGSGPSAIREMPRSMPPSLDSSQRSRNMLALVTLALGLTLGSYDGPPLPGSIPGTVKFDVRVTGKAGATVSLRALGVPKGYIAPFCTKLVCSPFRVSLALPKNGHERVELQLIENVPGAREPRVVTVVAGETHASIPFSRGLHGR